MPSFHRDLPQLLHRIYETRPGHWEPLLDEIKQFLGASAIALISHDFEYNLGSVLFARGYNQEYIHSSALTDVRQNVWLAQQRVYRRPGTIHISEHLVPEHQLLRTRFYTEWLQPQQLHHRLCAVLSREQAVAVFLEVIRPREWAAFDCHDVERCRSLLPPLQCALLTYRRIAALEVEKEVAFRALDQLPWGVIFVDEHRNQLATNRHAQEILKAGDGLSIRGHNLRAELPDETARLERLLSSALDRSGEEGARTLSITRSSGAPPLNVVVMPLQIKTAAFGMRGPIAAIFIIDPDTSLDSANQQLLRELYSLTAVEARLTGWLLRGKPVDEAAAAMGITVNTARAYLKRIYHKTGVRRQPELVRRLLLGLPRLREDRYLTSQ